MAEGKAFPQEEGLEENEAKDFFASQTFTGVAEENGKVLGLYILHPNNIGRCGHLGNASMQCEGIAAADRLENLCTTFDSEGRRAGI